MKTAARSVIAAWIFVGAACVTHAGETLPVLVFAGQSNANGFGMPSQLPAALRQAQPNVLFNNAYVNSAPAWAPLAPPTEPGSRYQFGNQYNLDYADGACGPELTAGRGISAAMGGKPVALVKYSLGATSLAVDWNPDHPQGWKLYPAMVVAVNASVAALRAQHPDKNVQLAGFFWMQGESDTDGPAYLTNLTNFIARVRQDFGSPNLPFIIGQLGAMWTGNAISQAQAAVATPGRPSYVHDTRLVSTADLPVIFDNMHFNTEGVQKLGDRYAAAYEMLTGLPVQDVGVSPADANLLSGQNVVTSSQYSGYLAAAAADGTAAQHVFADGDKAMRLVIHGFNSPIKQIRIWRSTADTNRVPAQVTVRSSASNNASLTDTFETSLIQAMALGPKAFPDGCLTINVDAPTGTRSLYFDFGGADANGSPYGDRIMEVQAFTTRGPSTPAASGLGNAAP